MSTDYKGRAWNCPQTECTASRHDDWQGLRAGCKSGAAYDSHRRYRKRLRFGIGEVRRVSPLGSRRRLQALVAIGWSFVAIGDEMGWRDTQVREFAYGISAPRWCSVTTAKRIDDVFERLCMTPGGRSASSRARAMNIAVREGWVSCMGWDEIDDPRERPKRGSQLPGLGRPDPAATRERVASLIRSGKASREIADDLGMHRRSVERIRSALRDEEAA